MQVVATGLVVPWSILFLPDGRMWITERPGRVREIANGSLNAVPVYAVPDVVTGGGENGLLGMCLHPQFATNSFVYLDYTDSSSNEKVVRYTYSGGTFTNPTVILNGIPAAGIHDGGRIAFGPDGKLYITTGDAQVKANAQDLGSLSGKILRLNDDGSIPADNPFVGQAGARAEIWTYGHRNPQGIDWDPNTGTMWESEHGPSGFDGPEGYDKINVITKGANYGWPLVYGANTGPGLTPPALVYVAPMAPAALVFYNANLMPGIKGQMFVGALKGTCMLDLLPSGTTIAANSKILFGHGRLRAVVVGPDGALYFGTSNLDGRGTPNPGDDQILRLVPR